MRMFLFSPELREYGNPHDFVLAIHELQPRWHVEPNPYPHEWELTRNAWRYMDAYLASVASSGVRVLDGAPYDDVADLDALEGRAPCAEHVPVTYAPTRETICDVCGELLDVA